MKNIPLTENEINEIKDHYSQELEKIQKRANEIRGILEKMGSSKHPEISKVEKLVEKTLEKTGNTTPKKAKIITAKGKKVENKIIAKGKAIKELTQKAEITTPSKNKLTDKPLKSRVSRKEAVTKVSTKVSKRALKSANAEINKNKTINVKEVNSVKKGRKKSTDSKKSNYEAFILNLMSKQKKMFTSKAIFDAVEKDFKVSAADYSKMRATVTVILSKEKAGGKLKDMNQPGTKAKLYGLTEWFDDKGNLKDLSRI